VAPANAHTGSHCMIDICIPAVQHWVAELHFASASRVLEIRDWAKAVTWAGRSRANAKPRHALRIILI
jgi:hypothetical protein